MQNQWKLLSQLRDYLNKANLDKNQQIGLSKDWFDTLQKLTYSQLDTIRKLSSSESIKTTDTSKSSDTTHKSNDNSENARVKFVSDQGTLMDNSTTVQQKIQQVIKNQFK